jgi:hypothetical protein
VALRWGDSGVLLAKLMPFSDLDIYAGSVQGPRPAPGDLVWYVSLGVRGGPTGGQGTVVIIDSIDGRVIAQYDWIG